MKHYGISYFITDLKCLILTLSLQGPENRRYIPRRAVLYVPGSDERKLKKIPSLGADCIVMDCEDGVALSKKVWLFSGYAMWVWLYIPFFLVFVFCCSGFWFQNVNWVLGHKCVRKIFVSVSFMICIFPFFYL